MTSIFKYECKNIKDKNVIKQNFKVEYESSNIICYSINKTINRKIKLLKINNDKLFVIIDKILKNSIVISIEDYLTYKLSEELAKSIDMSILNNLRGMIKKN
jgi:hypothetical protein